MRIPLFVSASGILVVLAMGFAWAFQMIASRYERGYVRAWRASWWAIAAYATLAGMALMAVSVPALAPFRTAFALGSMAALFFHARALLDGMQRLCLPDHPASPWPLRGVALLLMGAAVLALLPAEPRSDTAMRLHLWRASLVALAWSTAYATAGTLMLRRPPGESALGRNVMLIALFSYAVLRIGEPATQFLAPDPLLEQLFTLGGLPLLVGAGAGMLITLLEVEQAHAVVEMNARSAAERTAHESEAVLAAALATSTDPVFVVNRDSMLVSANRRFVELVSQATGMTVAPGMALEPLMDAPTLAFWKQALARVLAGAPLVRQKRFQFSAPADLRSFAVRFTPVRERGSIIGVLIVAHDSTEEERLRKEMARREEWFRSLIENASDMIFQIRADGVIEYASPSVDRILGYDHTQLIGRVGFDFMHPDDVPTIADAIRRSLARDETVPTVVPFRARAANDEIIPLEGVSRPYTERDGAERLIVALRDVRERRRLEDELTGARRLESIGRLAGGVAHDFNNLLTAVAGNVTLLKLKTETVGGVGEHLVEIEQSVQRGAELTRRLLAFARQQRIEPRTLSIAEQVSDLERLLRRLLGEGVVLDLDVPRATWSVRADPTAFEQILVNLAVNSRDAMPNGGTFRISGQNVTIGASGRESFNLSPGDWVQLTVEDTGAGIPPELLGRIFEPFFTTKGEHGGTGLGLATVYGAVNQMGGQIRVDSSLGVGTTFTMFFPRVIAAHETAIPAPKPSLPMAKPGEVVLLMEDETPVRDVTTKLLRRLGYEVLAAADGETGVEMSGQHQGALAIVVSDIVMPGIHGDVACARIRERRPGVPVLFISGFSQEALRWQDGMPESARLLPKPFTLDDLAQSVRVLIDGAAAR